ncbi:hypothetical protein EDB80DRAFT_652774 [Ilyonectria destructans]|nr:hypothetical protein EDB80DRAFT_652774 [Ilyonectria destructans]
MFDVIWTDPDRELVGEHRAKKEKKREQQGKEKEKEKSISSRSSLSVRSSRSSTDSPFGFLRSRGLKQSNLDKTNPKTTGLLTPSLLSSRSPLSTDSDAGSYRHSVLVADGSSIYSDPVRIVSGKSSTSAPDTSQVVQALGPSSFVTKRTEVSWNPRSSDTTKHDLLSEILISSEPKVKQPMTPPSSPGNRNMHAPLLRSDSPVNLIPGLKFPTQSKTRLALTSMPNNPDNWRPPEEWDCATVDPELEVAGIEKSISEMLQITDSNKSTDRGSDLDMLQKEVRRMAAASPEVILSRLKEAWSTTEDESLHHELEMEKKRWMLSTLHHLDPVPQRNNSRSTAFEIPSAGAQKILALYESQATASYLAALHPTNKVYHMSATPLSHTQFPNIHPILVPSVSPSVFPVAPQLFEIVYSLSMPAICSSPDIPGVLKNICKSLKQGGSLQLTLIDPLPCAGTLGQRMRTWLEEHLLLNLERHFQCMNPSKLFPDWLGEASLRGRGSTLTKAKFFAIPTSIRYSDGDSDPFVDRERSGREVKAELRSLVGRMLWMEVWGAFVTAEKWWWEDEKCVEECLELGTFWEYKMIEGVKDG